MLEACGGQQRRGRLVGGSDSVEVRWWGRRGRKRKKREEKESREKSRERVV